MVRVNTKKDLISMIRPGDYVLRLPEVTGTDEGLVLMRPGRTLTVNDLCAVRRVQSDIRLMTVCKAGTELRLRPLANGDGDGESCAVDDYRIQGIGVAIFAGGDR